MRSARKEAKRLAFVAIDKDAKPEFSFYRDQVADISLRIDELTLVQPAYFSGFHCGRIVLAEEPSASAYASLVDRFFEQDIPVLSRSDGPQNH